MFNLFRCRKRVDVLAEGWTMLSSSLTLRLKTVSSLTIIISETEMKHGGNKVLVLLVELSLA